MSCPGQLEAPCEKDGGDDNTIAEEIITDKAELHTISYRKEKSNK